MKSVYRGIAIVLALLGTWSLSGCAGSYGCQVTFGNSTCNNTGTTGIGTTGTGGGGGGGGGTNSTPAYAYAVDESGTIDGYALGTTELSAISNYTAPSIGANGGGVGMVVAQSQFLYAGLATTNLLYGWSIATDGTLTAIPNTPYTATFLSQFIGGVGQANMITDPAGKYLFISDATLDGIYAYTIASDGELTLVSGSPFVVPFPPMNLTTDGQGRYLYAVAGSYTTHQATEIAAYSIGTGSGSTVAGALTAVTGSPFSGAGFNMWQLQGEPTGQFLIGTTGSAQAISGADDDHLYVFAITQSGTSAGAIAPVSGSPFVTDFSPFSIAVQSNTEGNLIYSFSFNDTETAFNSIEGYTISSTGQLTALSQSPFNMGEGDGTWGQFDQSGSLLFTYSSFTNNGTTTTYLSPLAVGTTGALTHPIATYTLPTPGFWVVTDPK